MLFEAFPKLYTFDTSRVFSNFPCKYFDAGICAICYGLLTHCTSQLLLPSASRQIHPVNSANTYPKTIATIASASCVIGLWMWTLCYNTTSNVIIVVSPWMTRSLCCPVLNACYGLTVTKDVKKVPGHHIRKVVIRSMGRRLQTTVVEAQGAAPSVAS